MFRNVGKKPIARDCEYMQISRATPSWQPLLKSPASRSCHVAAHAVITFHDQGTVPKHGRYQDIPGSNKKYGSNRQRIARNSLNFLIASKYKKANRWSRLL